VEKIRYMERERRERVREKERGEREKHMYVSYLCCNLRSKVNYYEKKHCGKPM
jgi:hypothetical protein